MNTNQRGATQDALHVDRLYLIWLYKAEGIPLHSAYAQRPYRRYVAARKRFLARYGVEYADHMP